MPDEHGFDPDNEIDPELLQPLYSPEARLVNSIKQDDLRGVAAILKEAKLGTSKTKFPFIKLLSFRKKASFKEFLNQAVDHKSAIIHAVEGGNSDIVKEILKYKDNLDEKDLAQAFILAQKTARNDIGRLLLPSIKTPDLLLSSLQEAIANKQWQVMLDLLDSPAFKNVEKNNSNNQIREMLLSVAITASKEANAAAEKIELAVQSEFARKLELAIQSGNSANIDDVRNDIEKKRTELLTANSDLGVQISIIPRVLNSIINNVNSFSKFSIQDLINIEQVSAFLENGKALLAYPKAITLKSMLNLIEKDPDGYRTLLKQTENPNIILMSAIGNGNVELTKFILENLTVEQWAVAHAIKSLAKQKERQSLGNAIYAKSVQPINTQQWEKDKNDILKLLNDHIADKLLIMPIEIQNKPWINAFIGAVNEGDVNSLRQILGLPAVSPDSHNVSLKEFSDRAEVIDHAALAAGTKEINAELGNEDGKVFGNALQLAASSGNLKVINLLLSMTDKVSRGDAFTQNIIAGLTIAAHQGHKKVFEAIWNFVKDKQNFSPSKQTEIIIALKADQRITKNENIVNILKELLDDNSRQDPRSHLKS